ncbi:MAG TPA: hypothetical protein VIH25_11880 [Steroidobacteraceae bacterium]
MLAFVLGALVSAAQPGCSPEAAERLSRAVVRAAEFDLEGASAQLDTDVIQGCESAQIAMVYVRGLIYAEDAFRQGAPPASLVPVRQAIASLEGISKGRPGSAAVALLVLQAAAAAAQSEREEMRLYLESAAQMESLQQAAGQPGAPLVSAAEAAGDLWLQVHRYDDARRAYAEAARRMGFTARILAGLARSARRLNDMPAACAAFHRLLESWGARLGLAAPIAEARAYVASCQASP